jgi:hypothetical protein
MPSGWYPVARAMLRWYPPSWRARYGDELLDVLDEHDVTARTVRNLFLHAMLARLQPRLSGEGAFVMPRLRPRLLALVTAFPLFLLAFGGWFIADEPTDSDMIIAATGGTMPVWRVAETVMGLCLEIMVVALIVCALVVAILRARGGRRWRAIGHWVAAALIASGATVLVATAAIHSDTPPPHPELFLLVLVVGVLTGMFILGNAAARARSDRRTAQLVVVPAAFVSTVLLAAFVALVGYAADMAVHGIPLITDAIPGDGSTGSVHVYPIDALPADHGDWLPSMVGALVVSLVAFAGATSAVVGAIRGLRVAAAPA